MDPRIYRREQYPHNNCSDDSPSTCASSSTNRMSDRGDPRKHHVTSYGGRATVSGPPSQEFREMQPPVSLNNDEKAKRVFYPEVSNLQVSSPDSSGICDSSMVTLSDTTKKSTKSSRWDNPLTENATNRSGWVRWPKEDSTNWPTKNYTNRSRWGYWPTKNTTNRRRCDNWPIKNSSNRSRWDDPKTRISPFIWKKPDNLNVCGSQATVLGPTSHPPVSVSRKENPTHVKTRKEGLASPGTSMVGNSAKITDVVMTNSEKPRKKHPRITIDNTENRRDVKYTVINKKRDSIITKATSDLINLEKNSAVNVEQGSSKIIDNSMVAVRVDTVNLQKGNSAEDKKSED